MPVWGRKLLLTRPAWWLVLCLGLMPLLHLVWLTGQDGLGANPAEYLIRATGDWTLRGLCLGLARAGPVSPPAGFVDVFVCLPAPDVLCPV